MAEKDTGWDDDEDVVVDDVEDDESDTEDAAADDESAAADPEAVEDDGDDPEKAPTGKERRNRYEKRFHSLTQKLREAEEREAAYVARLNAIEGRAKAQETERRVSETETKARQQLAHAEREYREAADTGDTDAMLKAQRSLFTAQRRVEDIDRWKAQQRATAGRQAPAGGQPPAAQQPPAGGVPKAASDWARENADWFNKDADKTGRAYAINAQLLAEKRNPNDPEFYKELNRRLNAQPRPKSSQVAPATRTTGKGVSALTKEQKEIADSLGVSYADYAKELTRLKRERAAR